MGASRGDGAGDLGFLALALGTVGQEVKRIAGAHDAGPGEGKRDARGVDGDQPKQANGLPATGAHDS